MNGAKIPVGISARLLGDEVRFGGGHQRDRFVTGVPDDYVPAGATMPIVVNLDRLLLERRMTLTEPAERIGIPISNRSI